MSIEYGSSWWLGDEHDEYWDINNAMIDSIENVLPIVRRVLAAKELEGAQAQLQMAQQQVARLLVGRGGPQ